MLTHYHTYFLHVKRLNSVSWFAFLSSRAASSLGPRGALLGFMVGNSHFLGLELRGLPPVPFSVINVTLLHSPTSPPQTCVLNRCSTVPCFFIWCLFLPVALPRRQQSYGKTSPSGPVSTHFLPPPHSTSSRQRHHHINLGNYPPTFPSTQPPSFALSHKNMTKRELAQSSLKNLTDPPHGT